MIMLAFVPICSFPTFVSFFIYFRKGAKSAAKSIFIINAIILIALACILTSLIVGSATLLIVSVAITLGLTISFLRDRGNSDRKPLLLLFISGSTFIVFIILWALKLLGTFSLAMYASTIYPVSFVLLSFGILNLVPLPIILESKHQARMVKSLLMTFSMVLCAAIISDVLYTPLGAEGGAELDMFSEIFFNIMENPQMATVLGIMVLGALVKTVPFEQAKWIGDALYIWVPFLVWILVVIGVSPVPDQVLALFEGYQLFGWITYILLFAAIFVIVAAMISLFTSFSEKFRLA